MPFGCGVAKGGGSGDEPPDHSGFWCPSAGLSRTSTKRTGGEWSLNSVAAALFAEMDEDTLAALAEKLVPFLALCIEQQQHAVAWLDVGAAAEHLACPRSRIYALVSARRIPHHKDGSRLLFRREELDEWVRLGGGRRP